MRESEKTKERLRDLVLQLKHAPGARTRLRIAKEIESEVSLLSKISVTAERPTIQHVRPSLMQTMEAGLTNAIQSLQSAEASLQAIGGTARFGFGIPLRSTEKGRAESRINILRNILHQLEELSRRTALISAQSEELKQQAQHLLHEEE
jgi:hypothetical protein